MDDYGSKLKYTQNENVFEVEEILTNILLRLPVKSLLICKSVCKYWWSLICSRSFMNLHLIQSRENPTYVFHRYTLRGGNIHLLTKTDEETTERFLPGCPGFYSKGMICSFNGLICCIDMQSHFLRKRIQRKTPDIHIYNPVIVKGLRRRTLDILICNPATQQVLLLPPTPESNYPGKVGVSFGPTINEYKVFQFFYTEVHLYECLVYSSITGSWKSIGTIAHSPSGSSNHVCINGIVYWFSISRIDGRLVGHILAVDREEKFSIIRFPEEETLDPFLVNLEGCLCLVSALQDSMESVWIKKWSDYIPSTFDIEPVTSVAVRKNEILFADPKLYVLYNMRTRSWRNFNRDRKHGTEELFSVPMAYTESLLPCKY
ncbi:hypothetical protein PVL29_025588 [Vitis rotundifolia]|uniref:F-box domain-containing protein n=1 Tax=Vitis rotundifolia TaxID=103349 RepID=A0AA39D7F9_VITRO|nr:hypothetical protein PVL29_025588 [Vitis rotundifolia]